MVEAVYWFGYVRNYEEVPVPKTKVVEKQVDVPKEVPDPEDPDKTITIVEKQTIQETIEYEELEWKQLPYTNPKTAQNAPSGSVPARFPERKLPGNSSG